MRKINFFERFYISAIKPKEYYKLLKESLSSTFIYIIILSLLTGFISFITPTLDYLSFINLIEDEITNGFPEFALKEGVLDVKAREPMIIKKAKKPIIIIDTSGSTTKEILDEYDQCILILKDKLFYKKSNINVDEATYDFLKNIDLDKETTKELLPKLRMGAYLIESIAPFLIIILNLFLAFVISLVASLMNALLRWPLKYRDIYKMSVYSVTTAVILGATLRFLNISLIFSNYIYIVIGCLYIFIAFKGAVNSIED